MILFSSFSDFFVLLLFLYTGLLSGFLFIATRFLIKKFFNKIEVKLLSNEQKSEKRKSKSFFRSFLAVLLQILESAILFCCLLISWYLNFNYNYGHIRIICVFIWLIGFLCARTTLKMFAKSVLFFYNKKKKAKIENR